MRRKLTLIEELNRMKGLMIYENGDYKNPIIKEDVEGSGLNFKTKINFAPGWYTHTDKAYTGSGYKWNLNNDLSEELNDIKEFLLNNPTGYIVDITMSAGESQIPNTDNTPKGKRTPVSSGYLSKKRLNTIEVHIKNVLEQWKTEGINTENIKIKKCYGKNCGENELDAVGPTNWVGQEFCPVDKRENDPEGYKCTTSYRNGLKEKKYGDLKQKYDEEQFLDVAMSVKKIEKEPEPEKELVPFTPECVTGLEIEIVTKTHQCNNSEFFLFANNTLLKNVEGGNTHNGSNANTIKKVAGENIHYSALNPGYGKLHTKRYGRDGDIRGERSDTFKITNEQSKEITKENENGVINLFLICVFDSCHTDLQTVTITHPKIGKIFSSDIKANNNFLISLSPCGDKVVSKKKEKGITMPEGIDSAKNKWFTERKQLSTSEFSSDKKKNPNKKYKPDYKALFLDKITYLSNYTKTMLSLIKNITDEFKEKNPNKKDSKSFEEYIKKDVNWERVERIYKQITNKIKKEPNFTLEKTDKKNSFELPGHTLSDKFNFQNKFLRKDKLASDIRIQYPELLKVLYQVTDTDNNGNLKISISSKKIWNQYVNLGWTIKYPNEVVNLSSKDESVEI